MRPGESRSWNSAVKCSIQAVPGGSSCFAFKRATLRGDFFFSTLPETEEFRTTWIVPRIREPVALVSLSLYLL